MVRIKFNNFLGCEQYCCIKMSMSAQRELTSVSKCVRTPLGHTHALATVALLLTWMEELVMVSNM